MAQEYDQKWYVECLYITNPFNEENNWYLLLNHSRFNLGHVKCHMKRLKEGSEADQYAIKNMMWSRLYLGITLSNYLLYKVLTMVP